MLQSRQGRDRTKTSSRIEFLTSFEASFDVPCLEFAFLKVVGYSLSSEQRYVGGKLFSRNISNMTFFSLI